MYQGPFNFYPQFIHVERFNNIIVGSILYAFHGSVNGLILCYEKKGNLIVLAHEFAEYSNAAEVSQNEVRDRQIEDDEVEGLA